jgi:hypothetical protein
MSSTGSKVEQVCKQKNTKERPDVHPTHPPRAMQGIKPEDIAKYNKELPMSTVSTPDLKSMEPEFDQRSGEPKSVINEAAKRGTRQHT